MYFLLAIFILGSTPIAAACDTCACTLARCNIKAGEERKEWFLDLTVEQQNWDKMDARGAHNLHHEGHHVHNKTHEEFYHFTLGVNPVEDVTLLTQLPYVTRESIEIHDHARLGAKEQSEGIGDLSITGVYRWFKNAQDFLGPVLGIKIPTGGTRETNSTGVRFEPELQPGSGSTDYKMGAAFQKEMSWATLHGNVLYTVKTKGAQDFEFGDAFSSYLFLDRSVGPKDGYFHTKVGLDMNLQIEEKQTDDGVEMADSGGVTLLLGPALNVKAGDAVSIFGNFLMPVYQDLGGLHQELDFVWNAGAKIAW
jgi:hypothetical protein